MDGFRPTERPVLEGFASSTHWGVRYAAAILFVAMALTLGLLIPSLGGSLAFVLFFAAVLASAQYGGLGPSVLAIVLALLALDYFFLPPLYSIGTSITDTVGLAVFVWLAILIHSMHRRQVRLTKVAVQTYDELCVAQRIQERLLPDTALPLAGFDIAGTCHPSHATGGDFFDYIPLTGDCWGIAVGDVSGHGFGSALLMAETHAVLRALALVKRDVGEILTVANRLLCDDTADDQFVTVFLARLDPRQRSLDYAGAGHEGYLLDVSGLTLTLPSTGLPLGILDSAVIRNGRSVNLEPGQCLILVTDGFIEAQDRNGCVFGSDRLLNTARTHLRQSARQIVEALFQEVERFCGDARPNDDLTAVVIKTG